MTGLLIGVECIWAGVTEGGKGLEPTSESGGAAFTALCSGTTCMADALFSTDCSGTSLDTGGLKRSEGISYCSWQYMLYLSWAPRKLTTRKVLTVSAQILFALLPLQRKYLHDLAPEAVRHQ